MGKIILKAWFCSVAAILFSLCAAYCEVYPTGRPANLFGDADFHIPRNWKVRRLPGGEEFLPAVYYRSFKTTVETADGPKPFYEAMPWAKDAIVRMYGHELKDPGIFNYMLENTNNPIQVSSTARYVVPGRGYSAPQSEVDEYFNLVLRTKESFGPRFLWFSQGEWSWGGVNFDRTTSYFEDTLKLFGIPPPASRDEAAEWWNLKYDSIFKRYQNAGIPVFSYNNTTVNHYEARKGVSYTGNEIAYANQAHDSIFTAFCRGAARQYGIPWGHYAAGYGGRIGHTAIGHSEFHTRASPDERRAGRRGLTGAYSAVPMQEQRRTMYTAYMAGGNFLIKESDFMQGMLAGYDPLTIERTDPRITALTAHSGKLYAGPYALMYGEFYENIVKKHDRGTPYTPVALMFDKNHGLAFKYSRVLAIGGLPYTAADEQMRAVLNTLFPYETPGHGRWMNNYAAGPFGEIFDVITTEAAAEVINSYRAVVLVGGARVDAPLAGLLKQHVENGGLLFMACEQMTPELWRLAGIRDTGKRGQDTSYLRASDFYHYDEPEAFEYRKVELEGAEPLFVAGRYGERQWPVATINRVGKGAVVAGTPVWMNAKGDGSPLPEVTLAGRQARMHSLFSEIMKMIAGELVPVKVYGSEVKVMYNRNEAGWVVTLMNNRGLTIAWPGYKPAEREYDSAGVVLEPRFEYTGVAEWLTGEKLSGQPGDAGISLVIPPGGIRIVEFRIKK